MHVINYATYVNDPDKVNAHRPAHREYMDKLIGDGVLTVGGPFPDGSGALFIYNVPSLQAAREIIAADPYKTGGVFAKTELKHWAIAKVTPAVTAQLVPD